MVWRFFYTNGSWLSQSKNSRSVIHSSVLQLKVSKYCNGKPKVPIVENIAKQLSRRYSSPNNTSIANKYQPNSIESQYAPQHMSSSVPNECLRLKEEPFGSIHSASLNRGVNDLSVFPQSSKSTIKVLSKEELLLSLRNVKEDEEYEFEDSFTKNFELITRSSARSVFQGNGHRVQKSESLSHSRSLSHWDNRSIRTFDTPARPLSPAHEGETTTIIRTNSKLPPRLFLGNTAYRRINRRAQNLERRHLKSIRTLSKYLSFQLPTDLERAYSVFCWITENVDYDEQALGSLENPSNSRYDLPAVIIKQKRASQKGYCNIFSALCTKLHLQSRVVQGWTKGILGLRPRECKELSTQPEHPNHVWSIVNISGHWYPIDSCWGSGALSDQRCWHRDPATFYFCTPPQIFRQSHYPAIEDYQFCDELMTQQEWINKPIMSYRFWELGLALLSERNAENVALNGCQTLLMEGAEQNEIRCFLYHVPTDGREELTKLSNETIRVSEQGDQFIMEMFIPYPGTFKFDLFARRRHSEMRFSRMFRLCFIYPKRKREKQSTVFF